MRTNAQVGALTALDLLDVLLADLDDGVFDGQQSGLRLDLDPGAREQADSYILRRDLANGIFNFAENLSLPLVVQPRNAGGIDGDSLSQAGKLLDDVALNGDANLFPSEEPPTENRASACRRSPGSLPPSNAPPSTAPPSITARC